MLIFIIVKITIFDLLSHDTPTNIHFQATLLLLPTHEPIWHLGQICKVSSHSFDLYDDIGTMTLRGEGLSSFSPLISNTINRWRYHFLCTLSDIITMNYNYLTPPSKVKHIKLPRTPPRIQITTSTHKFKAYTFAESSANNPTMTSRTKASSKQKSIYPRNPLTWTTLTNYCSDFAILETSCSHKSHKK